MDKSECGLLLGKNKFDYFFIYNQFENEIMGKKINYYGNLTHNFPNSYKITIIGKNNTGDKFMICSLINYSIEENNGHLL